MGEGFAGVGTALQEGVDNKVESETNDFVADLMAAGSQEERDAMIAAANDSFLDLSKVNSTNYELGGPDREKAAYETQLASKHYFDKIMAGIDKDNRIAINAADPSKKTKYTKPKGVSAEDARNPNDPKNTLFSDLEDDNKGFFDSWTPSGSDFGEREQQQIKVYANKFLETYGADISRDELNEAFNTETIVWDDRFWDDQMTFLLDGKTWTFDEEGSKDALHEKLMQVKRDKANNNGRDSSAFVTQGSKVKSQYFDDFVQKNPTLDKEELENVFFKIWNKNEKQLINKNKFKAGSEGSKLFKNISNAKDLQSSGYGGDWQGSWYSGPGSGYTEFLRAREDKQKRDLAK